MQPAPDNAAPAIIVALMLIPIFILSIVHLTCLVMVIVKMFQKGETTFGTVCAVLSFCFGIGALIAFVYGWMKSSEWGLTKVMIAWTVSLVLIVFLVVALVVVIALNMPVNVQAVQ